jgi:folate-dependent phosphoribosylglycinamide formyltransferase PurN
MSGPYPAAPRVILLGCDDAYSGLMQAPLLEKHPDWVVGSVISAVRMQGRSAPAALWYLLRRCGAGYVWPMLKIKVTRPKGGRSPVPADLARRLGVPVHQTRDVNCAESLDILRSWDADVAVSTNFNQIIGEEALRTPACGTWNLHKSLLPQYRGMAPSFFALLNGEQTVGATLHVIDRGIDTGPILAQTTVDVRPDDTVDGLNRRIAANGGEMLVEYLESTHPAVAVARPQPEGDWPTNSYPTRAQVRAFRAQGLRFV